MRSMFTNLYSSVNRIFTQRDVLFRKPAPNLQKALFMTNATTIDDSYMTMSFEVRGRTVYCIKSPKEEFLYDTILLGGEPTIVIILPAQITFDDYDSYMRAMVVFTIYRYLFEYIRESIVVDKQSSLFNILNIAPNLLGLFTLDAIGHLYDIDIEDIKEKITKFKFEEMRDSSIEDLLDYGAVLGFFEDKKEEK